MSQEHKLTQYKLNQAKSYAKYILESVAKIELLAHLSDEEHLDTVLANNGIFNTKEEIIRSMDELKTYLDMPSESKN